MKWKKEVGKKEREVDGGSEENERGREGGREMKKGRLTEGG